MFWGVKDLKYHTNFFLEAFFAGCLKLLSSLRRSLEAHAALVIFADLVICLLFSRITQQLLSRRMAVGKGRAH